MHNGLVTISLSPRGLLHTQRSFKSAENVTAEAIIQLGEVIM